MRLLDLRRSASAAELAQVHVEQRLSSIVTDGCCALAGRGSGGVVVWNLDPASASTAGASAIASSGAGMAYCASLSESNGADEVIDVSMGQLNGDKWCLAAGHAGGRLALCAVSGVG